MTIYIDLPPVQEDVQIGTTMGGGIIKGNICCGLVTNHAWSGQQEILEASECDALTAVE